MVAKEQELDYDVIIVGAGISGLNFAYRLQESDPGLRYCILDRRHEVGGTWSLFKYPGKLGRNLYSSEERLTLSMQASDQIRTFSLLVSHGAPGLGSNQLQMDHGSWNTSRNPLSRKGSTKR